MSMDPPARPTEAVLGEEVDFASLNEHIGVHAPRLTHRWQWWGGLSLCFGGVMLLFAATFWLFAKGVGVWGLQIPVAWGFAIVNFVWWIGIGHAGTFISAILLLLHQDWRNSINRFTEAMTLFAVACAGLFPLLHLGRPQYFYYLLPYPNDMELWPQFRSPLVWDFFAVATYATVSLIFWYVGLVPDLASLRDRTAPGLRKKLYAFFSLGWLGTARTWRDYRALYIMLAGLATPLVVSVHSIVGLDFAISIVPGWHSTIFPPYFVAGAIFSGFAMVVTLIVPIRRWFRLEAVITSKHLDNCGKVMLATSLMVGLGYLSEYFFAWYSGHGFERSTVMDRLAGVHSPIFYPQLFCNLVVTQLLWWQRIRVHALALWTIAIFANIGMWLERYLIVVTALARDFLPPAWQEFRPTFWDWATYAGTIGLFLFLVFLFVRMIPMVSMHELRELVHKRGQAAGEGGES